MAYFPPIPKGQELVRKPCPNCKSLKEVVVALYGDGSKTLECEGCNEVLQEREVDLVYIGKQ